MAAGAIESVERLPTLDFGKAIAGGLIDHVRRHRLGDEAEHKRRYRLARLGFFLQATGLEDLIVLARRTAAAREAELRHAHPFVPGAEAIVIVATRVVQF